MVLDDGLCKTPRTVQVDMERVCPQAAEGYVLVTTVGELGVSHTCQKAVAAHCVGGKVLHRGQCRTRTVTTATQTEAASWSCASGTLVSTSGEHGTAWSCKIATGTSCPTGERYRNGRCEKLVTDHQHANYRYECPPGYTLGYDGIGWTCTKSVPPYCTGGLTYRTSPSRGCYRSESFYRTAEYSYSCPSGYDESGSGASTKCSKTEKYRKRVCGYDPFAGQQCWWEDRTRTVTKAPIRSCPSGFSPFGSRCRAVTASTRWKKTTRQPVTTDTKLATRECPSGYSPHGSRCRKTTTQWKPSGSAPVTSYRYEPADPSCRAGYSWDATIQLCAKTTTTTTYSDPTAPITTLTGRPPILRCPAATTPAGGGRCGRTVLGPPTQLPTDACSDDLGSLGAGSVSRTGTLAAGCESWNKGTVQSPHHARRYSLSVPTASKLDVAASSSAADVFVQVMTGSGAAAAVVASDDDSGTGTDAALQSVQLAAGVVYTVEVTTSAENVTGAFALTLAVAPDKPPVKIVGLADAYGIGQAHAAASGSFTVEPAAAACTAAPAGASLAAGQGANRTVSWTAAAPFSQEVTVACTAAGRSRGTAQATMRGHLAIASLTVAGAGCTAAPDATADHACTVPAGGTLALRGTARGPSGALSLAWAAAGGVSVGARSQAKTQVAAADATPVVYSRTATATVSCTKAGTVTLTAAAGAHKRTAAVAVACGAAKPLAACDDPLGTLPEGVTTRAGTIAADADCTTASRQPRSRDPYYTRRHTFTLDASAQVTVDVGNDPANARKLDTYALLLGGHGADGTVIGRDDDGGPGTDSRIAKKLAAGDYTIEATTWGASRTGGYKLTVEAEHDKQAKISGLAATTASGLGQVTVTAGFTVAPPTAACTASPAAAAVANGTNAADRVLTAKIAAPGSLAVTVTCQAAGHARAIRQVALSAELAAGVATIGARAISGGECTTAAVVPADADAAYTCVMAKGGALHVEADAAATAAALALAWTATGGVTIDSQTQSTPTPVVGPDSTTVHRRTATATLNCTRNGTATATATLGGSTKTARLTVACQAPVTITGLDDTTKTGTGQVTVTDAFTVTPATATCTAEPASAAIAKGSSADARILTATIAAPGSLDVSVACRAAGRYRAVRPVTLTATLPCADHIGLLKSGTVTRSGTITNDTACTTAHRGRSGTYYTRRHTFALDSPGWVTVDLKNAASNADRLDTYLILLKGVGTTVTVIDTDDDSGDRTDSRLADTFLQAGTYAIEATTYRTGTTGNYTLTVDTIYDTARCAEHLGTLTAGRVSRAATISARLACATPRPPTAGAVHYARRHTFTLTEPAWVDIDTTAAAGSQVTQRVSLLAGRSSDGSGARVDHPHNTGSQRRIIGVYLPSGDYTIETTTADAATTGAYTLTVTVPISGLPQTVSADVDEQTTINFTYWPTNANVAAASRNIAVAASGRDGSFSLVVAAERPSGHSVSVRLSTSAPASAGSAGAARGASARNVQRANAHRTVNVTVNGECPSGKTLSPINKVLCVTPSSDSDPRLDDVDEQPVYNRETDTYAYYDGPYEVTVGALLGARDAAREALDNHTTPCTKGRLMGVHELTALMLAIGVWENPNSKYMTISGGRVEANMRFPARSLMTLSRKDHEWTPVGPGDDNSLLYSYNSITRPPSRAFWHPGVGMWQIDKLSSPDLNHGQRADTRFGGVRVAETLLKQSCSLTHSHQDQKSFEFWLEGTWKACEPSENRTTTTSQCLRTKDNIWMSNGTRDDLFVTARNNRRDLSRTGGAELFECRWRTDDGTETIDGGHEDLRGSCYFYDTSYPEGSLHAYAPLGGDTRRRPGPATNSSSPYAAPFVSFTDDGVRFAVFPASFLSGHFSTPIKTVPDDALVRTHTGKSWHTDDYLGKDLRLWLCRVGALFAPPQCAWVSVNADASAPEGSFASWIAAARG